MTPTPTSTHNAFALLMENDDEDTEDEAYEDANQHNACHAHATPTQIAPEQHAISDTGATSHFMVQGAPVINIQVDTSPITITLPDGATLQSTHTCNLDIPWLPATVTAAHIVPGLAHSSLISTRRFCDAGYTVAYDADKCIVSKDGRTVLVGQRDTATRLWHLPINPRTSQPAASTPLPPPPEHQVNNVHTIHHIQNRVKYMHQAFFCPPHQTLIRAANLGFLDNIPFLMTHNIHTHLANSPATAKGRMRLHAQGLSSTWHRTPRDAPCNAPTEVFCFAALADKQQGTFYSDCTGALPVRALDGQQLFFVAYAYDPNYIFAIPIASTSNEHIIAAYKEVFQSLTDKGYKPTFSITDNQASAPIRAFLQQQNCRLQFVEPNNHRVNAAERAIQTFKNHFISGLCSTEKDFPFQLWNHMATQAVITCNILRRSRLNPDISAYEQLHGRKYHWNAHPLAPPGTRAVIYESPANRASWAPRGVDAWYCGPALEHYRCCHFYVPDTRAMRISGTYELYPTHCLLPKLSHLQHTDEVFNELLRSISPLPRAHKRRILTTIVHRIRSIAATNKPTDTPGDVTSLPWPSKGDQELAATKGDYSSTNPTAKHILRTAPRVHLQQTRTNNPPTAAPTTTPTQPPPLRPPAQDPPTIQPALAQPEIRRSPRIVLLSPRQYSAAALLALAIQRNAAQPNGHAIPWSCEHFCAPVIHPITGESIAKYNKLQADPHLRDIWARAFGKEFGNLAQGDTVTNMPGTNSIFVLTHEAIRYIPRDQTVTYT